MERRGINRSGATKVCSGEIADSCVAAIGVGVSDGCLD